MFMEKLKSVILFTLFIVCMGLTSQLLYDFKDFGVSATDSLKNEKIDYENILNPQSCKVSFGGGLYSGIFSNEYKSGLWTETKTYLKNYIQYLDIEQIDQEAWNSAVEDKSVLFVMPYEMSLEQVSAMLLPNTNSPGMKITFNQIIIPASDERNFYIGSDVENKYFRLKGVVRGAYIRSLIEKIDADVTTIEAKRIEDLMTLRRLLEVPGQPFKENNVLLPNKSIKELAFIKVRDEVAPSNITDTQLKNFIVKVFGERKDFVKKVEDLDGSVVYIYGYGEKALKISVDGSIEYRSKTEKRLGASSVSFIEGLGLSLQAIDLYGSRPEGLYLSKFSEVKNDVGDVIKRYTFNYLTQNLPLYIDKVSASEPIEIEITNSEVSLVKRDIKKYISDFSLEFWNETKDVLDLLQDNNAIISANFAKYDYSGSPTEDMNRFKYEQMQSISKLELCYFYDRAVSKDNLAPTWKLQVGSMQYLINAYSGEIMHVESTKKEAK